MNKKRLDTLLAQATQHCEEKGARMTPLRREVFLILAQQPGAIGAYDLLDLLKEVVPNAKPPTIYRALDFLQEQGFVHRISTSNSFILCTHFDQPHVAQMLICTDCNRVEELHSTHIDKAIIKQASARNFDLHHQTVEAQGICQDCQQPPEPH